MSIYATHWVLKFPAGGYAHRQCEWVEVIGQGVPAHVGSPTPGYGYEDGDPYADFLPPAVPVPEGSGDPGLRAMVVVTEHDSKAGPRYLAPLLVLSGSEYAALSFEELHDRVCEGLRGGGPPVVGETYGPGGATRLHFADGSSRDLPARPGGAEAGG